MSNKLILHLNPKSRPPLPFRAFVHYILDDARRPYKRKHFTLLSSSSLTILPFCRKSLTATTLVATRRLGDHMISNAINKSIVSTRSGKRPFSFLRLYADYDSQFACPVAGCEFRANQKGGLKWHTNSIQYVSLLPNSDIH